MLQADHEILTKLGWKKISDITLDDLVATHNLYKNVLEWNKPIKVKSFKHDGDMYHIANEYIDICVTLNHKMVIKDDVSFDQFSFDNFSLKLSKDIIGRRQTYKLNYENKIKDVSIFEIPSSYENKDNENKDNDDFKLYTTISISMNSWLEFLAIYLTHGSADIKPFITFNIDKLSIVNKLLTFQSILGTTLEYSENNKAYFMYSTRLYTHLKPLGDLKDRQVPDYALNLSMSQSLYFLESLTGADDMSLSSGVVYHTYSKLMADAIQIIAMNSEYSAMIFMDDVLIGDRYSKVNIGQKYAVYINDHTTSLEPEVDASEQIIEQLCDMVYGLMVPNNIFMTRRNGLCCWTAD